MAKANHYMTVILSGPLMIVRVPWPRPLWRHVLRAMTAVMQSHGGKQKDISSLDGLISEDPLDRTEEEIALVTKLEAAFDSHEGFVDFWLYDWTKAKGGSFKLVRRARPKQSEVQS